MKGFSGGVYSEILFEIIPNLFHRLTLYQYLLISAKKTENFRAISADDPSTQNVLYQIQASEID